MKGYTLISIVIIIIVLTIAFYIHLAIGVFALIGGLLTLIISIIIKSKYKKRELYLSPPHERNLHGLMSQQYHFLLLKFNPSHYDMVLKLQNDETIAEQLLNQKKITVPLASFISFCVIYDMIQITRIVCNWVVKENSMEATGLVLLTSKLLPNINEDYMKKNFLQIAANHHYKGKYRPIAKQLLSILPAANPIIIYIDKKEENNMISNTPLNYPLTLPPFLKIIDSSLFDDYITSLNQFANIIAEADGIVSEQKEKRLKEIYKLTHHPLNMQDDNQYSFRIHLSSFLFDFLNGKKQIQRI